MIQLLMDKFKEEDGYEKQLNFWICMNMVVYDVDEFHFLLNHAHFSEDQLNNLKLDPIFNLPKYWGIFIGY